MANHLQSVVRRTSLFVKDMARAMAFYREVFGLSVYVDREVDMAIVPDFPLGPEKRGGGMRLVILNGEDPLIGMIGLMEVSEPVLAEPDHDVRRLGYGSAALVLSTTDAKRAAAMVESLGGRILMPVTEARNIGDADGNVIPAKLFMANDPDGYFLEVFQPL